MASPDAWNNPAPVAGEIWLTLPDGTERRLEGELTIGRDDTNTLVVPTKTVSRNHAAIVEQEGRWYVEDRGSYNGTFLNGTRVQPGSPVPLRHADRIGIGEETILFSAPTELDDPNTTEPMQEIPADAPRLSPLQTQVLRCLCDPWLAGASLDSLPSNEQIAALLGTPGAADTVKAALRRIYAKAGLEEMPAHAKRRALCRVARQLGWV
jgi:pSer/pThr/pTyr-binding forkhead associated (FHA) protein